MGGAGTIPAWAGEPSVFADHPLAHRSETLDAAGLTFGIMGTDKVPMPLAPHLGQHSRDVLRDAHYSDGDTGALHASGAIGGA